MSVRIGGKCLKSFVAGDDILNGTIDKYIPIIDSSSAAYVWKSAVGGIIRADKVIIFRALDDIDNGSELGLSFLYFTNE